MATNGIERGKKTLSKKDLARVVLHFDDDILPIDKEDGSKSDTLNFYVFASDYAYIWGGYFKNYKEFKKSLDESSGYWNFYINYNPYTKTVSALFEPPESPDEEFELEGDGVEPLIKMLEEYCQEMYEQTATEIIEEYNDDNE